MLSNKVVTSYCQYCRGELESKIDTSYHLACYSEIAEHMTGNLSEYQKTLLNLILEEYKKWKFKTFLFDYENFVRKVCWGIIRTASNLKALANKGVLILKYGGGYSGFPNTYTINLENPIVKLRLDINEKTTNS